MISAVVMGQDKSDKLNKNEVRPPLGDVTNQLRKRGFSLVSSSPTSASKSGIGNKSSAESGSPSDSQFWKQVALVVEKLEKERGTSAKCTKVSDETGLSPLKGGKIYRLQSPLDAGTSLHGNTQMGPASVNRVVKDPPVSALDNIDLGEDEGEVSLNLVAADQVPKESCIPSVTVAESFKNCQKDCLEAGKCCQGEATTTVLDEAENDCSQEVVAAKVGSSRLMESQDMGSFSIERCSGLKDGSCSNLSSDLDSLKLCSCTFCSKAAYIWSDLHYQDVKGRMSISMKSQKEASNLARRYTGGTEMVRHVQGKSNKVNNTETDLTSQWKSIFLHMENVFGSETSLLQANFLALKDIREEFKTNLEMISGLPSDVQSCSSDASDNVII